MCLSIQTCPYKYGRAGLGQFSLCCGVGLSWRNGGDLVKGIADEEEKATCLFYPNSIGWFIAPPVEQNEPSNRTGALQSPIPFSVEGTSTRK